MIPDVVINFTEGWACGWAAVTAIATCVLVIGIGVAIWQVRVSRENTRKSTSAQLALGLFNELRRPESRKRLRDIYRKKPHTFTQYRFSSIVDDDIDSILDILGMIGTLVDHKILDEKLAIKAFGGVTVVRCWYQFGRYVKENLRIKRGLQSGSYFEDFACRALNNFHNNKNDWIRMYHSIGDDSNDLIQEFCKDQNKALRPKRIKKQPTIEEIKKEISER